MAKSIATARAEAAGVVLGVIISIVWIILVFIAAGRVDSALAFWLLVINGATGSVRTAYSLFKTVKEK